MKLLLGILFLLCVIISPNRATAQTLVITDNSPTENFINEQFCYTDVLSNIGVGTPGYGPYLQLIVPPNVSLDAVNFLGAPVTLDNLGVSTGAAIADPNLNTGTVSDSIYAPAGSTVYIVNLPIGSIVDGGPEMAVEFCWTISLAATIGVAESIDIIPVYQFGDTPTGDNGPLIFPTVTESVIPIAYRLTKVSDNFEQEKAPGACEPVEYTINVDIANGFTLNNLVVTDILPAQLQFLSIISNGGCTETTIPSTIVPGGNLVITCPTATGTLAGNDVEIIYDSYVIDFLDETICEAQQIFNAAQASTTGLPSQTAADTSLIQHMVIVHGNNAGATVSTGQTVTYTIDTEVTEYTAGLNGYTLTFTVPDGMVYNPGSLTWGGAALNPLNVTVTPVAGSTGSVVTINLFAENGGNILPCNPAQIEYTATVQQQYFNGDNIVARDDLTHTSNADYSLVEGATNCSNGSSSGVVVTDVQISKAIINSPPVGPGRNGQWIPGDIIQYQISVTIPSNDLDNVVLTDYFPIPIHNVMSLAPAFGTDVVFDPSSDWTTPPIGYTQDPTTNSLALDFGDVSDGGSGLPVDIVVNIDIIIDTLPYANGLQHANFAGLLSDNTANDNLVGTAGTVFVVGAPELVLDKNVVATDNPSAVIDASGNVAGVDALDTVHFEIIATNIGDAQAYTTTITDVVPPEMFNCALEPIDPVTYNTGVPVSFTGGFTGNSLNIVINDSIPFAGNPGGDAAIVSFYCIVDPNSVPEFSLTNTADGEWRQVPAGVPFPTIPASADVVAQTINVTKDIDSIYPSVWPGNEVTIGDFVQYEVVIDIPEGQVDNAQISDQLDLGLAFIQIDDIVSSSPDLTSSFGPFAGLIGTEVISTVGASPDGDGRLIDLNLGNLTNTNSDNTVAETITIRYTTSVVNTASNVRGTALNNTFDFTWDDPNTAGTLTSTDNAPNVTIVEPELVITKGYLDNAIVPGDETFVTLDIDHTGVSDATAYDVTITDTLQLGMNYIAGFDNFTGSFSGTPVVSFVGNIITLDIDSLEINEDITFSFKVELDAAFPICDSVQNCAYAEWESLLTADQVGLPSSSFNSLVGERTGDTTDIGALNNFYLAQSCAPLYSTNEPTDPTISSSGVVCEGESVTLSVNPYTGSVVTYNWSGPNGAIPTNSNEIIIDPVTFADTGDYFIIVNVDGCVSDTSQTFNVQINSIPTVAPANNGTLCMAPGTPLQLTSNGAGGSTPYSYSWTGPNGYSSIAQDPIIPNPTSNESGTYFLVLTDDNGCTADGVTQVNVSNIPAQPIVSSNTPICSGENLTISTQTYTGFSVDYSWSGPSGPITNNSNTLNFNPGSVANTGNYSVSVTVDGCTSNTTVHAVTVHPNPTPLSPTSSSPVCAGNSISLLANNTSGSTYSYSWSGPNGFSSINENETIPNASAANSGSYTLMIIDSNSCTSSSSTQVNVLAVPTTPTIEVDNATACLGEAITFNVTPAYSGTSVNYNWNTPSGVVVTTTPTLTINPATVTDAGAYFISSVDIDGCSSNASNTINVTIEDNNFTPAIAVDNSTVCEGDFFSLSTSTVADSYSWTGPNGYTATTATPAAIQGSSLTDGTYSLVVTTNGCTSDTATIAITVNATPPTPSIAGTTSICNGDDIVLSTSSSCNSFLWIGPGGSSATTLSNPLLNTAVNTTTIPSTDVAYAAGNWSVVCVSVDGCESPASTPINVVINDVPVALATNDGPICENGNVQLIGNTVAGATYEWYDEFYTTLLSTNSTHTINSLPNGTYTYNYIVNSNGCVDTASTVVTVSTTLAPPNITANSTTLCEGDMLLLSSTTTADSYSWTGPNGFTSSSQVPAGIVASAATAGTYTLNVVIAGCGSSAATVNISVNPLPATPVLSASNQVCDGDNITLSTTAVASNYYWITPAGDTVVTATNNHTITPVDPDYGSGNWTLFVENANGCFSANSNIETITINPLPVALASNNGPICANGDATLTGNTQAGATYQWFDELYTTLLSTASVHTEMNLAPGTYTYNYIVNSNGCVDTASTVVTVNTVDPAPAIAVDNSTVCEGDFFSLSTSTVADSYSWTGPNGYTATTATPAAIQGSSLTDGTYSLVVTTNGCTSDTATIAITVNATPPTPSIAGTTSICNGDDIVLSTSSSCNSFLWIGPGGSSATTLSNPLLNTAVNTTTIPSTDVAYAAGNWSVVCVSVDGCESPASTPINVVINDVPVALATNDGPICENGNVQLIGNTVAGATYEWYDEFYTTLLSTNSTHTINSLPNGTYTYNYIVNSNGCVDTASTVVTVSTTLAPPNITANSTTLCEGDMLLLSSTTTADSYSWTGPNGFTSSSQVPAGIVASAATAGTYTLNVVIAGCGSSAATVNISVNPLPATPVLSASNQVCDGDNITLSTTAVASNYYWITPAGDTVVTATNNHTITPVDPDYGSGNWTLFVENANGCFSANSNIETITINPLPVALASNNGPICANGDATLTGNTQAGATYQWFDELYTTLLSTASVHTEMNLAPGTYTYNYIVNSNGCVDTASTVVTVNTVDPTPAIAVDNSTVCEGDFFSLSTSTVADSYSWTGPNGYTATTATPAAIQGSSLTDGTYSLVVTTNGCTSDTATIVVTVNNLPATPVLSATNSVCEGDDISFSTTATATNYYWIAPTGDTLVTVVNNVIVASTDVNYGSGDWSLIVENANGCFSANSNIETITINPLPVALASNNGPICANGDATLTGNTQAGATYQWFDELYTTLLSTASVHTEMNLAPGTYTYNYIVNSNGCVDTASTVVTVNTVDPAPAIAVDNSTVCEGDFFSLSTSTVADSYSWTGPNGYTATTATPAAIQGSSLTDGTYSLVVTTNGCTSDTATIVVTVNNLPATPVLSATNSVCEGDDISFSTTATATNYYWIAPTGDTLVTVVNNVVVASTDVNYGSGDWSLIVENANGCFSANSNIETITINPLPVALASNNGPICANGDATLTGNTQAGATYQWFDELYTTLLSTASVHTEMNLAPGTYTYNYIVNSNGCVDTVSTIVTVDPPLTAPTIAVSSNPVCEGDQFILSTTTVADSYSWTGPNGYTSSSSAPPAITGSAATAGTYSLAVTINGCTSALASETVVVNALPSAPTITGPTSICDGDDLVLSTSSTCDSYLWIGPGGSSSSTLSNPLLNTTTNTTTIPSTDVAYAAGDWSVVCVSPEGCESPLSAPINVSIIPVPSNAVAASNSPVCEGDDILLTTNGVAGATYTWSGTNGFSSVDQNPIISNAQLTDAADYSVTISFMGCSSTTSTPTTVIVNTIPAAPVPLSNSPVCEGDTIFLYSNTAATSYNWTGPNGFTATTDTAFIPNSNATHNGFYNLTTVVGGCPSPTGQVQVDVVPSSFIPTISSVDNELCVGEVLELNTTGFTGSSAQYIWYGPSGTLDTTFNPTYIDSNAVIADSGDYYVQVLIGSCLSLPSQIELIDVNSLPGIPDINYTATVCEDDFIQLSTTTIADSYEWQGPNGFSSNLQNPAAISPASVINSGNYSLNVTLDGCSSQDSVVTITVNPKPATPTIFGDSPICVGDSLVVYTTSLADNYQWTAPNGTITFSPSDSLVIYPALPSDGGTYSLELEVSGCFSDPISIDISIDDSTNSIAYAGEDFYLCNEATIVNLNAEDNGTGFWSTNSNATIISANDPSTLVTDLEVDSTYIFYWTLVSGSCGGTTTDSISVYVPTAPIANTDYVTVIAGQSIDIDVMNNDSTDIPGGVAVTIDPLQGLTSIFGNEIEYSADEDAGTNDEFVYELCYEACPEMCDTAFVFVSIDPLLNIPDIITPNGDGSNDAFVVEGIDNYPSHELKIFNRWGNEIFFSDNYQNDWDGIYNGEELPDGTYYYVLINTEDGELLMNGYITLHR